MTDAGLDAVARALEGLEARIWEEFGDLRVEVAHTEWLEAASRLRDHVATQCNHFVDLSAVHQPSADADNFEVVLSLRAFSTGLRVRMHCVVAAGVEVASVVPLWQGANWAEREAFDMFGIVFSGHGDLRRILMYDGFEGHPLRKDYPIERAQPLVEYRESPELAKVGPFGAEEGQPWGRIDWAERLKGADLTPSHALAVLHGQKRALSDSEDNATKASGGADDGSA